MPLNATEAKGDAESAPVAAAPFPAELAQPASKEPADKAPKGNMGALAKNLSAWRREG